MFTVIFILWGSATVGYLLRRHPIPGLERLMTYTVWGLLFLMGVEVGGNPTLMQALTAWDGKPLSSRCAQP